MQRRCMKNAALVLAQKTFSFQRKLNFSFTQKNFFCQNCVCKMVDPKFETGFWPLYWVSSGGWWLYGLVYPHRFSGSQEKNLNWLLVLNKLGFINKNKILTYFAAMAATQISLYNKNGEKLPWSVRDQCNIPVIGGIYNIYLIFKLIGISQISSAL